MGRDRASDGDAAPDVDYRMTDRSLRSFEYRSRAMLHNRLLNRRIQASLGQGLRVTFEELGSADIPDRFLKLLAELEAKEHQK